MTWPDDENAFAYDPRLIPQSPAEYGLTFLLRTIQSSHDVQHDLVKTLITESTRLDEQSIEDVATRMLNGVEVPDETRSAVRSVFDEFNDAMAKDADARYSEEEPDLNEFLKDPTAFIYDAIDVPARLAEWISAISKLATLPHAIEYLKAYSYATSASPRGLLFLRAGLIAIVGDFEVQIRRIVSRYLEIGKPELSREDRIVEVRRLFGGGIEDWATKLQTRHNLDIKTSSSSWSAVVEIFARRHLHIHQGGFVDAGYRGSTGSSEPDGMPLILTPEYLDSAIDLLSGLAMTVLVEAWTSLIPDLGSAISSVVFDTENGLLHQGCFVLVEDQSRLVERFDKTGRWKNMAKVNRLLAERARLGDKYIASEASAWDRADLHEEFQLARLILLGQNVEARRLFDQLRESDEITDHEVETWFLFKDWIGLNNE